MTRTISTMAITGGLVLGGAGLAQADDHTPAPAVQDSLGGGVEGLSGLLDVQALIDLLTGLLPGELPQLPVDQLPTDQLPTDQLPTGQVPEVPQVEVPATPAVPDTDAAVGSVTGSLPTDPASLPIVGGLLGAVPLG